MGLSHKPAFRKNYLNPALEAGLIERTIPDNVKSSNPKAKSVRSIDPGSFFARRLKGL